MICGATVEWDGEIIMTCALDQLHSGPHETLGGVYWPQIGGPR